jgi:hypothetical protein
MILVVPVVMVNWILLFLFLVLRFEPTKMFKFEYPTQHVQEIRTQAIMNILQPTGSANITQNTLTKKTPCKQNIVNTKFLMPKMLTPNYSSFVPCPYCFFALPEASSTDMIIDPILLNLE